MLQCFCFYHIYKNQKQYWWYFVIFFVPLVGCLAYLYMNIFRNANYDGIVEEAKGILDNDYEIQKLEKENRFADTIANKLKLANAYLDRNRFNEAIDLFQSCLTGNATNDPGIKMSLLKAYFLNEEYSEAVSIGNELKDFKAFQQAEERVAYAWSLYYSDEIELAQENFQVMDCNFTNYMHRLEFARFLDKIQRTMLAKVKLEEILEEIDHMDNFEKKNKKAVIREIQNFYDSLN